MAKITAEQREIVRLKNLITLEGNINPNQSGSDTFVDDFLIEADEEEGSVSFSGVAKSQNGFADVTFHNIEVEEGGNVVVQDIEKFTDVISLFDPDEEIEIEDNGKTLDIEGENMDFTVKSANAQNLKSKEGVENVEVEFHEEEDEIHFGENTVMGIHSVIRSSDIDRIIEVGEVVDTTDYPLEIDDGELISVLGDKTTGQMTVNSDLVETDGESGETVTMRGLGGIGKHLVGDIDLYMEDGGPLSFRQETEEHEAHYYLLPSQ